MSHAWSVSAAILVVACAIALSIASAEAQNKRKKAANRSVQQTIQQPLATPTPYRGGRYNLPPGGGINFNDGGQGANYYGGG
jgi:hypothetical protein